MLTLNRRGVIGFMLTMAVGIALGAAALVVSNEIASKDKEKQPFTAVRGPSSPANVEKAFEEYQKAYRDYQQAVGLGRGDIKKYGDTLREAKKHLEIEIFRNTPGVSEMDMTEFETARNAPVPTSPIFNATASPFSEGELSVGASGSAARSGSAGIAGGKGPSERANQESASAQAPSSSSDGITGMDYYRVKAGDSLSKICEKYYGNSGMWQHIIKYQATSIAATPNLIFPGQLIVLPRGLTGGSVTNTQSSASSASSSSASSSGNVDSAPAGDESWQEKFQQDYVISDRALTNSGTMSVAQIQKFLASKNSVLAKPYRGSSPAQMIYDAAKKYGINPQVILTRLQCEQGLISKSTATEHKLDWALGVGCYDSGNWNQKFKGFDKQVEYAAQTYRRHYNDAKTRLDRGESVVMTIDGKQVRVKNAATYSFYKYCPHFQGNKLFYDVWRGYRSKF